MVELRDWTSLIPLGVALAGVTFITYKACNPRRKTSKRINFCIKKELPKVSDSFDIEEIAEKLKDGGKVSLCRCWLSKKWPYCDGAHGAHNKETGDNVGPVSIKLKN